jgi:hypothetical protein
MVVGSRHRDASIGQPLGREGTAYSLRFYHRFFKRSLSNAWPIASRCTEVEYAVLLVDLHSPS